MYSTTGKRGVKREYLCVVIVVVLFVCLRFVFLPFFIHFLASSTDSSVGEPSAFHWSIHFGSLFRGGTADLVLVFFPVVIGTGGAPTDVVVAFVGCSFFIVGVFAGRAALFAFPNFVGMIFHPKFRSIDWTFLYFEVF